MGEIVPEEMQEKLPMASTPKTKDSVCAEADLYHGWRVIVTELIPMKVQDAYSLTFTQEKFIIDILAGRKISKYVAEPWTKDGEGQKRNVKFMMALSGIGVKSANITETHILSPMSRAGESYSIQYEVVNEGVPYADSFSILLHVCLLRVAQPTENTLDIQSEDWCTYTCYANIKYKKSLWSVVKIPLERGAYGGMVDIHGDVCAALKEYAISAKTVSGDSSAKVGGTAALMQARRKRRTKTASADLTTKMRKDAEKSNEVPLLLKITFMIFALSLVGLNVFLYLRVQELELIARSQRITTLEAEQPSTREKYKHADIGLSLDTKSWLQVSRILERQEDIYHQELNGMKRHLQEASQAMGTAAEALSEILQKLPQISNIVSEAVDKATYSDSQNSHLINQSKADQLSVN